VHRPPILFLDEPTSGVDPVARRSFWDLIHSLAEEGTTIFVSTHYMEEAEYCHRLGLMNRGRLIAMDSPSALKHRVVEPILEVGVDDAPGAVRALAGSPDVLEAAMFGRKLHVTLAGTDARPDPVRETLAAAGVAVREIHPVSPSLEDVFVSLVRAGGGALEG